MCVCEERASSVTTVVGGSIVVVGSSVVGSNVVVGSKVVVGSNVVGSNVVVVSSVVVAVEAYTNTDGIQYTLYTVHKVLLRGLYMLF